MGIFNTLIDELLGTTKKCEIKNLGIFTCKICSWWRNERYTWGGTVQLPSYSEETFVLLEGDVSGPLPQQIVELQMLLQNWESLIARLDNMLPRESRFAHKEEIYASWQDKFYPEEITSTVSDGWEITFSRTDDLKDYFAFIWKNNTVQDLELAEGA